MFSHSAREIAFNDDIAIVGDAISTPEKEIPILPDDVLVKRGLFGHYLSREIKYKKGDHIRPQHWFRSGDNVHFWTGVLHFRVPINSVSLRNPETGKITPIHSKVQVETETMTEVTKETSNV